MNYFHCFDSELAFTDAAQEVQAALADDPERKVKIRDVKNDFFFPNLESKIIQNMCV